MKKFELLFSILLLSFQISYGQTILSGWGFENVTLSNAPYVVPVITGGSSLADNGILITASAFDGFHPSYSTVWSTPVGNGSAKSLSSNYWSIGDWYVFLFRTTGYQRIIITWDQTGSDNGPRDFKVQYSIDGGIYTDATGTNSTYSLTNDSWVSSAYNSNSTRSLDLSSITSLNNQNLIYIKFTCTSNSAINGGTMSTTGTSSIDNFRVSVSPLLSVAPNILNGFTYMLGSGPSSSQSYNLSGINLTGFPNNITVSCLTNYEVSTNNSTFSSSVTVPYTSTTFPSTPIYVRLKSGLIQAQYNGEVITNTGGGATEVDVTCNGEVVSPVPVELTSFSASVIGSTVKLNWQTATEINNYGFEVERASLSASPVRVWDKIGFVNGNGTSNSTKNYSFADDNITAGIYSYRLKQIDNDGSFEYSKTINVDFNGVKKFELSQNYPNPFNPATTIRFNLPEAGNVKLTLYNLLGQEIKTLVNEFKEAGVHTVNFNASELNSGMYIYKIEAGTFVQTRKMTLIK